MARSPRSRSPRRYPRLDGPSRSICMCQKWRMGRRSSVGEHRRRRPIGPLTDWRNPWGRDPRQEFGGPRLDPIKQCGADAAPSVLRVDDSPRPDDVGLVTPSLSVGHDRSSGIVGHDPCVGRQIEVRPAPDLPKQVSVDGGFHVGRTLLGEQHRDHRLEVPFGRLPKRVAVGGSAGSVGLGSSASKDSKRGSDER